MGCRKLVRSLVTLCVDYRNMSFFIVLMNTASWRNTKIDWFDYLLFYVQAQECFTYMDTSPLLVSKFRPMLGAQGLWAGSDLYRATPTMTQGLGFFHIVQKHQIFCAFHYYLPRHSSIIRRIWLNFMALCFGFHPTLFQFSLLFSDFQLFRPEHHWRNLSSRNAHLVHQNW
jgi:hypothetical protein